ncbi:nicotinate-nucleotide adenylyltransferase [Alkalihalobacillus sp. LMS39]|uniref:nicotinate-nucleotide adenylyltransferase n=1 Tax=Alkalihalobacillus sp. LMS39 TaxID=2924032 RepID=UPI001FB328CA|nr:nicotinate-nucleotide adenylyltransferase [Alkalihalobacillus sp. LMS39]UOE95622.1 nicotinate-nucleotide adenylyltransferase [Alkalihalobacillus sp. LMS39]
MKKIGILGGTFDPPHLGHLLIAEEVRSQLALDEIWFMPSYIPPHKTRDDLSSSVERKTMVELAIKDNGYFSLSTLEIERKGRSYTIDTMKQLKAKYEDVAFYFIIGGDMIEQLHTWVEIEYLLGLVTFVGLKRPQFDHNTPYKNQIIEVDVPQVDISSSLIRQRVSRGESIRYLVPDPVGTFIRERGLYGEGKST